MKLHTSIGVTLLALGTVVPTAANAARLEVEITTAPPAPPTAVIVTPAPRAGHVYVPGHYVYETQKYVWKEPAYVVERPGFKYEFSTIEKRGDKWVYRAGDWVPG